MFGNFGPWELVFILLIVLMIFGPGKLPKVGESLGKAIKSFRTSVKENDAEKHEIV